MKKQDKLQVITQGIDDKKLCRIYFSYEPGFFYCYPNAVNDKFIMGQEEDDFLLDGYFIRKISHINKVEIRADDCDKVNTFLGISQQVAHPGIDITDWRTIFEGLSKLDNYLIIEDHFGKQFAIGVIEKVLKNKVYFRHFNAKGEWAEGRLEIPYSSITSVEWGSRYPEGWKKYLEQA